MKVSDENNETVEITRVTNGDCLEIHLATVRMT